MAFGRTVTAIAQRCLPHGGGAATYAVAQCDGRFVIEVTIQCQIPLPSATAAFAADLPPAGTADGAWQLGLPFADQLTITRDPQPGTILRLTHDIPANVVPVLEREAPRWREALSAGSAESALQFAADRIRQLAAALRQAETTDSRRERELQELRDLNERLELLALVASKTDNAVIILTADGRIEWANDSFVRISGLPLAEARGRPLAAVLFECPE